MFWPVLYETLRTIGLSVVTTHTQFSVRGMDTMPMLNADVETVTHRIAPGSVWDVVGILSGIISDKLIIAYYAAISNC
jgi:hypothetical protein